LANIGKKMTKLKFYILSIILVFSFGINAQTTELIFKDEFGNTFKIYDYENVSEILNSDFLMKNINTEQIKSDIDKSDLKYDFIISDFEKLNRNNVKFKVTTYPRTNDTETIIRYLGGGQYFNLKIKRTSNGVELRSVEYLYSVI
jgi:hypothetical protein